MAFLVCRGGWPRATTLPDEIALEQAFDYYDVVVNTDASQVDGVSRNPERVKRLMRSYSRHQGTQVGNQTICDDIAANDAATLDSDTVLSYINALKKIFVIEDMSALESESSLKKRDTNLGHQIFCRSLHRDRRAWAWSG